MTNPNPLPGGSGTDTEAKKKSLRSSRGNIKALLTKLEQWIEDTNVTKDEHDVDARLESLESYLHSFNRYQDELEQLDNAETAERMEMDNRICQARAKLKRLRFKLMTGQSGSQGQFQDANSSFNNLHVEVSAPTEVPLPQLPKFSGENYLEYTNFINSFKALVDSQNVRGLTKIKKFSILRNALTGPALEAVNHLLLTTNNYDTALEILQKRFHRPRLIFESLLKRLTTMPKVSNTVTLRKLSDHVESTLRALEGLPATPEQIGYGLLIHQVLKNVDEATLSKWEEDSCHQSEALPSWVQFQAFLDKRANIQESMNFLQSYKRNREKPSQVTKKSYAALQVLCCAPSGRL